MGRLETPMDKAFVAMGIISWIVGGAVFAIGLVLALDTSTFNQVNVMDNSTVWEATVLLTVAVGGFTFLIGFVGWIGHLFSNQKTLIAYLVLGSVASAALLSSGIMALVYKLDVADGETVAKLNQSLTENSAVWDEYQTEFSCCGVNGPEDWIKDIPASCCNSTDTTSTNTTSPCEVDEAYETGCYEVMKSNIDTDTAIIMGLSFGAFGMQISSTALGGVLLGDSRKVGGV